MDELHKFPRVTLRRAAYPSCFAYQPERVDSIRRDICNSINDTRSTLKHVNNPEWFGEIITIKIKGAEIIGRNSEWGPITDKEMEDTSRYLLAADQGGSIHVSSVAPWWADHPGPIIHVPSSDLDEDDEADPETPRYLIAWRRIFNWFRANNQSMPLLFIKCEAEIEPIDYMTDLYIIS